MDSEHRSRSSAADSDAPVEWRGFRLSRFQRRALAALASDRNVLVGAPTGAGKTLVAEYAIEEALGPDRRAVYTAPIKALSNQKYRDFREAGEDVGLMTGDVTVNPKARVLVMTTEILRNALFDNPELVRAVDFVVFDEVHYLDDAERGTVWEESLIFAPPSIRFICLSATIANIDELGEWIDQIRPHPLEIVHSEKRPVPLRQRLWMPGVGTFETGRIGQVRRRLAGRKKSSRPPGRRQGGRGGPRGRGGRGRDRRAGPPDPQPLLDELEERSELPALVFCFSRKECERLARRNRRRDLLDEAETRRMEALHDDLAERFQLDPARRRGEVFQLARHGVAYHHAGMLPIDKELVERMFTSGLVKMLFATETFALGINMPARAVVFPSLKKFDGVSLDWMRTRDFMQMAGRAGRQGLDEEGLVYSILSEADLAEAPLDRLFAGRPEPVKSRFRLSYSSILHLVERAGRERAFEAWEKSFDHFQHRESRPGARDRNRRRQRRDLEARLRFLEERGYLDDDDSLTDRARIAKRINGFEIQTTELLFDGALEAQSAAALAVVFVGLIHEERRPGQRPWMPARLHGDLRRRVTRVLREVVIRELDSGVPQPLKEPEWGLTAAVLGWLDGADLADLAEDVGSGPGDLCRAFRLALQLMRQVRHTIDPAWDLCDRLAEAMAGLRRDEVDARKQLELGAS